MACTNSQGKCDASTRPRAEEACEDYSGCYEWKTGDWSTVRAACWHFSLCRSAGGLRVGSSALVMVPIPHGSPSVTRHIHFPSTRCHYPRPHVLPPLLFPQAAPALPLLAHWENPTASHACRRNPNAAQGRTPVPWMPGLPCCAVGRQAPASCHGDTWGKHHFHSLPGPLGKGLEMQGQTGQGALRWEQGGVSQSCGVSTLKTKGE